MNNSLLKNTLHNIDWDRISSKISHHAYFNYTRDHVKTDPKIFEPSHLQRHYHILRIFIEELENGKDIKDIFFGDLSDSEENHLFVTNLGKGSIGNFKQLNFICVMIENLHSIKDFFSDQQDIKEIVLQHINSLQSLKAKFTKPFRGFVDRTGYANLAKHPRLREIIEEKNQLETKIRKTIQYLLKEDDIAKRLQFDNFDIINERYTLPIRSDSYNSALGIIVSRSSTGHTLFVEPKEVRELCNRRLELISQLDKIINDICKNYTELIEKNTDEVKSIYQMLLDYDYYLMQAGYCSAFNFSKPEITTGHIEIKQFFHPLIDDCMANDIEIMSNQNGLIISGPNTGGKTVSIKSIVLCHIFLKLGFFIPAVSAKLSVMEDIFYFDSDYQNLTDGLSSFAGETEAILEMLINLKEHSLVAADEIFNSTASDEASSLAISIINYLTEHKDAKVLISTHHQLLKTHMQENKNFVSAHMGFDFESNQPTYKLVVGSPGSSMALQIFENLARTFNIDASILQNAKSLLDSKYITYEKLLQDLSRNKSELDGLLIENRSLNAELKNQKKSMEGLLYLEKERAYKEYAHKLEKEYEKIKSLKKSDMSLAQIKNQAGDHYSKFQKMNPSEKKENKGHGKRVDKPIIGKQYFCSSISSVCELIAIERTKALVKRNGLNIKVPLNTLFEAQGVNNSTKKKNDERVKVHVFKSSFSSVEINARGMRLDEFQRIIDEAIISLTAGNIPYLNVVHGHGQGVLKKWLRDYLKNNKDLEWQPEDGNDGATRIALSK